MQKYIQFMTRPIRFAWHLSSGVLDVIVGKPWRRNLSDAVAAAYDSGVWAEGTDAMTERDKHFFQVGATFHGKRITDEQHEEICSSILRELQITNKDVILDACCGNGIITAVLAKHSSLVIGVDFSDRLLSVAREHYKSANTTYVQLDLLCPQRAVFENFPTVTKVCFHSAVQHFTPDELQKILIFFKTLSCGNPLQVFLGAVPDRSRKFKFYKTPAQRLSYICRWLQRKSDFLGTWWKRSELTDLVESLNGRCRCFKQDDLQHTAHYRFDSVIEFD